MIADIEKIVAGYLRDAPELGSRVVGKTPSDLTDSWVRLTVINAPQDARSQADHLITFNLQLDCYAGSSGGQPEASLLARTVRELLIAIPGTYEETVVSGARITSMARIPDTGLEPARERFILTATVWAH